MKIFVIASAGGHWVQLLRLSPAFGGDECIYASTKDSFQKFIPNNKFYCIKDFNRNNMLGILRTSLKLFQIIRKEKPKVIITTGAAPGLVSLFIGKLLSKKTVWIDSIANVEELSMSGKIASCFADRVYTQWAHLSNNKIYFEGNVIA
ncbi:oligosaccharide biosynthesis protein Alg14 [Dysgonomonas massiliensis]|uniref:oligosaccharide biosynthesis protein Alg14 n=1 Tax=Dysgonomonas massiliensis TaxID=2040292 RepID=UPI000C759A50|nr:oligosaccharide biosynthesis protein Alg14 [Dysgonomonas massiliensis]